MDTLAARARASASASRSGLLAAVGGARAGRFSEDIRVASRRDDDDAPPPPTPEGNK